MDLRGVKILSALVKVLFVTFFLSSCGGGTDSESGADDGGTQSPAGISENFKKFLVNYKELKESKTFGEDWLNEFNTFSDVKEIDKSFCKNFIYGNSVLNHSLGDEAQGSISIPSDRKYYYVALSHKEENFIGLVFTDNVNNNANTYFCTFSKEGKFISGMVIQAYQVITKDGDELYFTREGGITFENKSMILVKEIAPGKGTSLMSYRLDSKGVISKS